MAALVRDHVERRLAPVLSRLDAVERSVSKSLTYHGVWQRSTAYQRGAVVTHSGTIWSATKSIENGEQPGKDSAWQLMVKSA